MRQVYEWLFPAVWIMFLLYWQVAAVGVKATRRLEPAVSRLVRVLLFLSAIAILSFHRIPIVWLYRQLWPSNNGTFFAGLGITVGGLLFSVWARRHLGRNWSRSVQVKEGHELIETGPYRLVRHPIYTGLLAGFLGTAIAIGEVRGLAAFGLILVALWAKLRLEERWMHEQFGASYESYARRVAALVPFVL